MAAAWTTGFHWWRSDNKTPTQNVTEYMLVLALCLVLIFAGDWPLTRGVLNITAAGGAAAWTAGFHWWRSDNKTRTQNVTEYMLVLALCLVLIFAILEHWLIQH